MKLRPLAIALVISTGFSAAFTSPVKAEVAVEVIAINGAPGSATDPNPVTLDADLYLPEVTPAPAVVLAHGFGGSKTSLETQAAQLQIDQ